MTCACVAASLAHAANAGWRFERVGPVAKRDRYNAVAVAGDARGRRVIAWKAGRAIRIAVAAPGHGFGRSRLVKSEKRGVGAPLVALNDRGDVLILWHYFDGTYIAGDFDREGDCCFGVRLAVLHADGRLGGVRTLTPRGREVDVGGYAIDRDGRVGVSWTEEYSYSDGRPGVLARVSGPHGLRRARTVDRHAYDLALAFVHGRARVLMLAEGRRHTRLVERSADRRRRFGPRRVVARGLAKYPVIRAEANERGDEVVAWWRDREGRRPVRAGTRSPGAPLKARTIAHDEIDYDSYPTVAIAPSGAGAVAWTPEYNEIRVSTAAGPGQPFGRASFLLPPHVRRTHVNAAAQLGVNSRREVAVAWASERFGGRLTLNAAVRTATGRTRRHVRLGKGSDRLGFGAQETAAIDEQGRATVGWYRNGAVRAASVAVPR